MNAILAEFGKPDTRPAEEPMTSPYADRTTLEQLVKSVGENATLNAEVARATADRLLQVENTVHETLRGTHKLSQQLALCAEKSSLERLTKATGENALLNAQVAGATAKRLLQVEKTAHEASASTRRMAQQLPRHAEQSALDKLTKAVGQNAQLQAQIAEVTTSRLLQVESTVRDICLAFRRLEKMVGDLQARMNSGR